MAGVAEAGFLRKGGHALNPHLPKEVSAYLPTCERGKLALLQRRHRAEVVLEKGQLV